MTAIEERVLIAGAGPVGQVAAALLHHHGVPVTILEKDAGPPMDLRAGTFHPPSLEMMEPIGFTARLLEIGIEVPQWQFRDLHEGVVAEFDLGCLKDDTPYPFRLHCEQYKLTRFGAEMLQERGVDILYGHEVTGVDQSADGVSVIAKTMEGEERVCTGRWLIGCDGGRSAVRKQLGFAFTGFTWDELFVVLSFHHDFAPHGFTPNAYIADPDLWCAVFKMPGTEKGSLWRFAYGDDPCKPDEEVLADARSEQVMQAFVPKPEPYEFAYKSTYRVHQRVVDTFRKGRVLLAGDAAHINNPMGALGMNSGIQDAHNLAEKLAQVWHGRAGDALLDRYDRQRRTIADEIVQRMSTVNLERLKERDPEVRRRNREEMKRICDDPQRHYEYMLQTSMIASVRRAETID